jgi:hypothetical protein
MGYGKKRADMESFRGYFGGFDPKTQEALFFQLDRIDILFMCMYHIFYTHKIKGKYHANQYCD